VGIDSDFGPGMMSELQNAANLNPKELGKWSPAIIFGNFTLHSGGETYWLFDALRIKEQFTQLMAELSPKFYAVGIEFGGALMSQAFYSASGLVRKNGDVYIGERYSQVSRVTLIDDVCTTEASFLAAAERLAFIGLGVHEYMCIMDRRGPEDRKLEVKSLVTVEELGLDV